MTTSTTTQTTTIEKLVYEGYGLAKIGSKSVFVLSGLPGDVVEVDIIKKRKRVLYAKITKLINPSPLRIQSDCIHFENCGGCQIRHVAYKNQLKLKQAMLEDAISRQCAAILDQLAPIIPVDEPIYTRNKMDFAFAKQNNKVIVGLKRRGRFDDVIAVPHCLQQSEVTPQILALTSDFFTENNKSTWDYHAHTGLLRYLVIRQSKTTHQFVITVVVSEPCGDLIKRYSDFITRKIPEISGVMMGIQPRSSDSSFSHQFELIWGDPNLTETLLANQTYTVSPASFFQTNTKQARVLYQTVLDLGQFKPTDTVMDLYCGTGTIGMTVSPYVKAVIGIEENESAIEDAKQNAVKNQCSNIKFYVGRVKNVLKFNDFDCDAIIIDPPRSGMVPKALNRIIDLQAPKIVYVSCNPMTMLRDLDAFTTDGYQVKTIQPVDMFCHSYHVECVTLLEKKN